jgi:hypothetical protein
MSGQQQAQQQAQHQSNLAQAGQQAPSFTERREYLEAVIEDELDAATVGMLRNMTSPDFILSNLNNAEIEEIKKLREITLKKVKSAHPNQNSIMQGDVRAEVYEGGGKLSPLDQNQEALIDQYVRGAFARLVRSRDGFQQEQFGKTINASETRSADSDGDSGGVLPW